MKIKNPLSRSLNPGLLAYIALIIATLGISLHPQVPHFLIYIPLVLAFIPVLIDAIQDLRNRKISTEIFLVFATIVSLVGSEQRAITLVLLIMIIAKYIEHFIEQRTDSAIESLVKLIPTDVIIEQGSRELVIPYEQLTNGMHVIVKTGNRIPADGIIIKGSGAINESFLTGESIPQEKQRSDIVYAGSFVEAGSIVFQVTGIGHTTLFGKISTMLEQAEKNRAQIAIIADKVAAIFIPTLMIFILFAWVITQDMNLIITLLVFGTPLELTLVTPIAMIAGSVAAFRSGILIKGGITLEQFSYVDTVIFDKTGTLTIGEPKVIDVGAAPGYTEQEVIALAAIIEKRSGHVLAKAILEKAREENITIPDPETYESITGHGLTITYQNKRYLLGSKHFIQAQEHGNIHISPEMLCRDHESSHTSFYLCNQTELCGRICVTDTIRPDAQQTIQELRDSGISKIILLSGDKQNVADAVAQSLGITTAYGEISPAQKLGIIENIQRDGHCVAMIGDGINDAPALKQANVGIAMGAMGMEPAIEAADVVLMANDLRGIIFVRKLSQKTIRLIMQNIFVGFALVHIFGIVLALFHAITPIQAAFSHALSDVFILLNSARLMNFKLKK